MAMQNKAPKKIMVVDDDPGMLKLVTTFIGEMYDVVPVQSGEIALQLLASTQPDLMLLDYDMPGIKGKDVLRLIREDAQYVAFRNLPVFFLTGVSDSGRINECLKLRPNGYMLKPIGKFSLIGRLHSFFQEKEMDDL